MHYMVAIWFVPLVPILGDSMGKTPRENRVPIMMSDDELSLIDNWRFENRVATRSDAVRKLCQLGILLERNANLITGEVLKLSDASTEHSEVINIVRDICLLTIDINQVKNFYRYDDNARSATNLGSSFLGAVLDAKFFEPLAEIAKIKDNSQRAAAVEKLMKDLAGEAT